MSSFRRELGNTERNWCLVVDGGTGITVSAFLLGLSVSRGSVQAAVDGLLSARPFLTSQVVEAEQKLYFELSGAKRGEVLVEEVANPFAGQDGQESDSSAVADDGEEEEKDGEEEEKEGEAAEMWRRIVDRELNLAFPETKPMSIFEVHLYNTGLPDNASLVVLRAHTSAADMICTGPMATEFLNALTEVVQKEGAAGESGIEDVLLQMASLGGDDSTVEDFEYYKSIENGIPKGGADKPFWAHGTDVIGYGLQSRMHAYLPFRNTEQQRKSHLVRASLSKDATDRLLKVCEDRSTDLYGALCGAGLASVATFKNVGNRGEHYGVVVLYNCRELLDPKLPEDALGFYHSAISKTVHTAEDQEYWNLATTCTKEFADATQKRKHFTDMGNLNLLMVQAVHRPNLTPSSTLRTALFSILHDPVIESTSAAVREVLQLRDFVSASSTHGVGPCVGIFPFLRDGALHLSFVYCSPLFSHRDIQTLVDSIVSYITV